MISFQLSEEQEIARATMMDFARQTLAPEMRRQDSASTCDEAILNAIWDLQIIQSQADPEMPRSPVLNALLLEELAYGDATVATAAAAVMGFIQQVADQGDQAQRRALLPLFLEKDLRVASIAMIEPGAGFDPSRLSTRAERVGDGYRLDGSKAMVPLARRSSHFLVTAMLDGVPAAFIVESAAAGLAIDAGHGVLGLRALESAALSLEGVLVPAAMKLGGEKGCDVQRITDSARVGLTAIMAGLGRAVLDYTLPYTKDRIVHGSALGQKQTIAFGIADMHVNVEAMRWMAWKAAWALEAGEPATKAAQLAYSYARRRALAIADHGVQCFGGHGFVRAHPIELWYRNARALSVLEGIVGV